LTNEVKLNFNVAGCDLVPMSFNTELPTDEPERGYFDMWNNMYPYLNSINKNVALSTTDFVERNMTQAFLSEDETNCPCVSFALEKIVDSESGTAALSVNSSLGYQFSISDQGIFKYENYTSYQKFFLWVSCLNPAEVSSGVREKPNI